MNYSSYKIILFRLISFSFAVLFWWMGIGREAISGGENDWGGGIKYLTNWVLTLNLIVATTAIATQLLKRNINSNTIIASTMTMNLVIVALFWGIILIDQNLLSKERLINQTFFDWLWGFYLHVGMSVFLFWEGIVYNKPFVSVAKSYYLILCLFFGYILWLELVISENNIAPCGSISCGFPYQFLNDLDGMGRSYFYFGVWVLGTTSFLICFLVIKLRNYFFRKYSNLSKLQQCRSLDV